MSKFTQDEWKYMEVDPISEDLNTHKYVLWAVGERTLQSIGYIFTEANARLIVAAPELYELVREELIPTSDYGGILSFAREAKVRKLLTYIDGEEAEHE